MAHQLSPSILDRTWIKCKQGPGSFGAFPSAKFPRSDGFSEEIPAGQSWGETGTKRLQVKDRVW